MRLKSFTSLMFAAGMVLAGTAAAPAFSQIGRQDGTVPSQDGVIATPLPPLVPPPAGAPIDDATAGSEDPAGDAATGHPAAGAPSPGPAAPASPPVPPPASSGSAPPQGTAADPSAAPRGDEEEGTDPAASQQAMPEEPTGPPPDVAYGDAGLPAPVRDLRAKLIEIAKTGEIEKLRPYIQTGDDGTVFSFSGIEGDPIDFLKTASGDGEGVETLAILLEVLEAGHIKSEPGTPSEIYVWPYFSGLAVDKLTRPQKVELFELVTAGDYQEMVAFGAYNFYRAGISPDGKLQFFVAGD